MLRKEYLGAKNYFVFLIAAVAGFGGFLFGFDSSVIADTKNQIVTQFSLNDFQWSLIVSVSLLSSIFGIPLSGLFADQFSRKSMLLFVAIGFMAGTSLCSMALNLPMLITGRFIIGICIGIASYVSPMFIAEIAPASIRGGLVLLNGVAITLGQAFSFLIGYWLYDISPESWRVMLLLGTIPALLLLIGVLLIPHSPRWLLIKHGREAAYTVLKKIRHNENEIQAELQEMQTIVNFTHQTSKIHQLLQPPYVWVLFAATSLGVLQQFSGINAIMYYGPVIFESAGFTPTKFAILATFFMGFINFIFTIVTLLLVDKLGRRFLLICGSLLAGISLLIVSSYYHFHLFQHKWLMLSCMATFIIGYCVSIGSLFWVIISEIFPLNVRGLAMSIATLVQWMANLIVSLLFLSVFKLLGEAITFSMFATMCLLATWVAYYFIPETTGISLEQIELNLMQGKALRDLGEVTADASLYVTE